MIKERQKQTKYNYKKTRAQIIKEYLRTVLCSVIISIIVTVILSIHARNEMIKVMYTDTAAQSLIDKKTAEEIISATNLLKDLQNKKYSVCMYAGEIYETAGDYKNAQIAYELAVEKAPAGTYKSYYKLICTLTAQEKFDKAEDLLNSIKDISDKKLIKFKTRSYLTIGDKYYSIGKFLSAAKSYEKADFYYSKFAKKDLVIDESIKNRIINSYIHVADIMVKTGYNSDAVRFLRKAEKYLPDDLSIRYKLAIILSDSDPEESVKYFDSLLDKIPQEIDYGVYTNALMKSANIADLDGRPTMAKYYRYKIHATDLFVNRKVIYKNDIETSIKSFSITKRLFTYPLKGSYYFLNLSNVDIISAKGDFVLCINDKPVETITKRISDKNHPMFSMSNQPNEVNIQFKKKIFTKKELDNYKIKIYLYKDEKYKTLVYEHKLPKRSF